MKILDCREYTNISGCKISIRRIAGNGVYTIERTSDAGTSVVSSGSYRHSGAGNNDLARAHKIALSQGYQPDYSKI